MTWEVNTRTHTRKNKPGQEWERQSERYYCSVKNYFKVFVDDVAAAAGVLE